MEELLRENERLKQENGELRELLKHVTEQLTAAEAKIKQLSAQLKQNSRNSNWPSSRDKSRRKPKSLRPKTARKAGGQEDMKGTLWPSIQSRMSLKSIGPANANIVRCL